MVAPALQTEGKDLQRRRVSAWATEPCRSERRPAAEPPTARSWSSTSAPSTRSSSPAGSVRPTSTREIVPHTDHCRGADRPQAAGDHPLGRPEVGLRAPALRASIPRSTSRACPFWASVTARSCSPSSLAVRSARTGRGEYGRTPLSVAVPRPCPRTGRPRVSVWMSHGDAITEAARRVRGHGQQTRCPCGALHDEERASTACSSTPRWCTPSGARSSSSTSSTTCATARPRGRTPHHRVARSRRSGPRWARPAVLCALSGGVDSAVAAALVHKAIGDQLTCVFVDTGLMRAGRANRSRRPSGVQFHIDLVHVKAADRFFEALAGITDPEQKRKIIGDPVHPRLRGGGPRLVIEAVDSETGRPSRASWSQGTLYPDVIESGSRLRRPPSSRTTMSAGFPTTCAFELVEPLRLLFKDEVRAVGEELGLPEEIVWRQPFPGPGPGRPHRGRGHARAGRDPAGRRRHRGGGGPAGRALPRPVAELCRPARRPHRGRDGRRADLRLSHRHPGRHQRRCHDGRLGPPALRPAGADLDPDHQRGRRGQPGGARHHIQTPGTIEWE